MKACTSASGGVIFIPENINRKKCNPSNDNGSIEDQQEQK
jgi:hypothetical protein